MVCDIICVECDCIRLFVALYTAVTYLVYPSHIDRMDRELYMYLMYYMYNVFTYLLIVIRSCVGQRFKKLH